MDKLVAEIISPIFLYLPAIDKSQCRLVCKTWQKKIDTSRILCRTLSYTGRESLTFGIHLIVQNPEWGLGVQELTKSATSLRTLYEIRHALYYYLNLKRVEWIDLGSVHLKEISVLGNDKIDRIPGRLFWKYLERLTVSSCMFKVDQYLLNNGLYTKLKYLDITMFTKRISDDAVLIKEKLNSNLRSLRNAPALETLILRCTGITQSQLNLLHIAAPNLKELKLIDISVTWYKSVGVLSQWSASKTHTPAPLLESFSVSFASSRYAFGISAELINFFLRSISKRYKNLKKLDVRYHPVENKKDLYRDFYPFLLGLEGPEETTPINPFERPIKELLSSMRSLTSYTILLYPGSNKSILQKMDECNIRLKSMHIDVLDDDKDEMDEYYLQPLPISSQSESLEELTVSCPLQGGESYKEVYRVILRTTNLLSNLTSLKLVNWANSQSASDALLYVLKNIKKLEHLTIDRFRDTSCGSVAKVIKESEDDEEIGRNDDFNIYPSDHARFDVSKAYFDGIEKPFTNNLKTLTITDFNMNGTFDSCRHFSSLFERIGKSCHHLEAFTLSGNLIDSSRKKGPDSVLNLSFTSERLKSITVDMDGFNFYQFKDIPEKSGKYWKDYYHRNTKYQESNVPYSSINLKWKGRLESINLRFLETHKKPKAGWALD